MASSRFWAAGSESESEEGSVDSDDRSADREKSKVSRWATVSDSDDSSDEGERVVRSAKDRAWDGMKTEVTKIKNSMKINDWNGIQTEFDSLNKMVEKAKMHIMKEGSVPRFYIKILSDLEDFLVAALKDKDVQKKMNATNGRALNRMKLVLRRHNKVYEEEIAKYREAPDGDDDDDVSSSIDSSSSSDSEGGDDEDDDDDDGGDVGNKAKKAKDLAELDSDEWASSEASSSSEDEEETGELKGRAKWLKTAVVTTKRKKERKDNKDKTEKRSKQQTANEFPGQRAKEPLLKLDDNLTPEQFDRKLLEVVASRGRKNTDTRSLLVALEALAARASDFGFKRELSVLMHLVSAQFDINRTIDDYMDVTEWRACHCRLARVVELLQSAPDVRLGAIGNDDVADFHLAHTKAVDKETDATEISANVNEESGVIRVVGNLLSFLLRLEDEYVKSLQRINPHTRQYINRLKDEEALTELADGVQHYYMRVDDTKAAGTVALLHVEHIYYKHDSIVSAVHKANAYSKRWGSKADAHPASNIGSAHFGEKCVCVSHPGSWLGAPTAACPQEDPAVTISGLCQYVYTHGDDRCRTRALLCHVYHHALHGRFYAARDLLLMSHLQDTAYMSDVETQILFNRAMALLGICAFREGLVSEAHSCLAEICSSRVKELLAQGVQSAKFSDKNLEQEKAERRRQTPYHMHINLDLLECCHLTAAMLLEVPNMSIEQRAQGTRRPISRYFRKHMDIFNRQVFTGPPENTRDHILAAAKALAIGDWKNCCRLVLGLDVWSLLPGPGSATAVKETVEGKIKTEALRTYLFAFSPYYESLSLDQLCAMFELPLNIAHGLVSKMMINHEVPGSWDQPTATIVLHRLEPTPLQQLALTYADKAIQLVESNERLLDARAGGHGGKDERTEGGARRWQHDRWRSKQNPAWKSSNNDRHRDGGYHHGRGSKIGRGREVRHDQRRGNRPYEQRVSVRRW